MVVGKVKVRVRIRVISKIVKKVFSRSNLMSLFSLPIKSPSSDASPTPELLNQADQSHQYRPATCHDTERN